MRVLETKSPGPSTMVKRKHKLRKQSKSVEVAGSDSSDDGGVEQPSALPVRRCRHISKGVNVNGVRKALKQLTIGECTDCVRGSSASTVTKCQQSVTLEGATGGASSDDVQEPTMWVCLQCGHQGCDRNSKDKHALKHYQTPRSNSHAVVVNLTTWIIWCYDCDDEVFLDDNTRLTECIEYVKKQAGSRSDGAEISTAPSLSRQSSRNDTAAEPLTEAALKDEKGHSKTSPRESGASAFPAGYLPKVKGLSNLGNTCFFNAVMQNLSQTPILEHMLVKKGAAVTLPGTHSDSDDDESTSGSGTENEEKHNLEPLTVSLPESGPLTLSVSTFLRDMNATGKNQVLTPNALFGQVCRKAPRFKGFQQQDSHELLRHLLDGMKAEEIKRCQSGILKAFHLPDTIKSNKVDDDKKTKIKEYGRQAKYTFMDKIFGGQFISTVLCEECHFPSQIVEPFLDISLPITEEKPQRPNNHLWTGKKKEVKEKSPTEEAATNDGLPTYKEATSKHMTKKAQKRAKKEAKKKAKLGKGKVIKDESDVKCREVEDGSDEEEHGKDKDSGGDEEEGKAGQEKEGQQDDKGSNSNQDDDVSDADIEDNLESNPDSKSNLLSNHLRKSVSNAANHIDEISSNPNPCQGKEAGLLEKTHNDTMKIGGNCVTVEEELKAGSEKCLGGAEMHNAVRYDNRHLGVEGTTENGITDSSKAFESRSSEIEHLSIGISSLTITSHTGDELELNHKNESVNSVDTMKSSQEGADKIQDNIVKSKTEFWQEAAMKALNTLAPRYQPTSHECSVLSCLHQFTSAELLTGQNRFGCSHCTKQKHKDKNDKCKKETVYTIASKQILIFAPPAVLTLHLKRFQQVGFSLRKVNRHVEFPLVLDVAPYCSSLCQGVVGSQGKVLYSLYGIVEHTGRLNGGHYMAYVKVRPNTTTEHIQQFIQHLDLNSIKLQKLLEKLHKEKLEYSQNCTADTSGSAEESGNPPVGKWFYISDTRVSDANEQNVLRCQAYILFYERIH